MVQFSFFTYRLLDCTKFVTSIGVIGTSDWWSGVTIPEIRFSRLQNQSRLNSLASALNRFISNGIMCHTFVFIWMDLRSVITTSPIHRMRHIHTIFHSSPHSSLTIFCFCLPTDPTHNRDDADDDAQTRCDNSINFVHCWLLAMWQSVIDSNRDRAHRVRENEIMFFFFCLA